MTDYFAINKFCFSLICKFYEKIFVDLFQIQFYQAYKPAWFQKVIQYAVIIDYCILSWLMDSSLICIVQ